MPQFGPARAGGFKEQEVIRVKPLPMALAQAGLMNATFGGDQIHGQGAVYVDHELIRCIYFARMIAAGRGERIEVSGK